MGDHLFFFFGGMSEGNSSNNSWWNAMLATFGHSSRGISVRYSTRTQSIEDTIVANEGIFCFPRVELLSLRTTFWYIHIPFVPLSFQIRRPINTAALSLPGRSWTGSAPGRWERVRRGAA